MAPNEMREALKGAFSGRKWTTKVTNMSENQVTAVFLRLKSQNKV